MSTDTNTSKLIINKLSKIQYEAIANPSATELYLTPDTSLQEGDDISKLNNDAGYITGITSSDVTTALGYTPYNATNPNDYQTAGQVSSAITSATSSFITKDVNNLTNYTTTTDLNTALEGKQPVGDYATNTALTNGLATKQNEITASNKLSYSLLSDTPTIPTVPTNVSAFTNDAGYITSSYHDSTKQDILVEGTGIDITNNTISSSTTWGTNLIGDINNQKDLIGYTSTEYIKNTTPKNTGSGVPLRDNAVLAGEDIFLKWSAYAGAWGNSYVQYSEDGIDWYDTNLPQAAINTGYLIAYGEGHFVAIEATNNTDASNNRVYTSDNGKTWTQKTLPSTTRVNSIAYSNGTFVICTYMSTQYFYSTDYGETWISSNLPISTKSYSIGIVLVGGNNGFIVVGDDSTAHSSDGINWTTGAALSPSASIFLYSAGNYYYKDVQGSAGTLAYSSDGLTWASVVISGAINILGVAYSAGIYGLVVYKNDYLPYLYKSTDGINWTQADNNPLVTFSTNSGYSGRASIIAGLRDDIQKFVIIPITDQNNNANVISAVSFGGYIPGAIDKKIKTHNTDTSSHKDIRNSILTKQNTLISGTNIKTINNTSILGSGNIDIQGGSSYTEGYGIDIENNEISVDSTVIQNRLTSANAGDNITITNALHTSLEVTSSNPELTIKNDYTGTKPEEGIETEILTYLTQSISLPTNTTGYLCYGDNKFVVVGYGSDKAGYSTDGINWTASTLPYSTYWNSITYGNGKFVAVAQNTNQYAYSTDGINWTPSTLPYSNSWSSITYGNGKFVAVAQNTSQAIYSTDGINWIDTTLPSGIAWLSITYGNGKFVVVASGSNEAAYSTDGINWTESTLPSSASWLSVTYGNGKFVAVGQVSNKAAYSIDGINWTASTLPSSLFWYSVTYGNGKFVAVASGSNQCAYSTNGINWTLSSMPSSGNFASVVYGYNKFIVTNNRYLAYSIDGVNWSSEYTGWTNSQSQAVELSDYQLSITSGTPSVNNTLNLTYTTTDTGILISASIPNLDNITITKNTNNELQAVSLVNLTSTVAELNYVDGVTSNIQTQLNNKQDVCIHIIDTYVNGTSGYRIWSDGYCEQWGVVTGVDGSDVTTTFIKTFATIPNMSINFTFNDPELAQYKYIQARNVSTTSFQISAYSSHTPQGTMWKASGYLAEGQY